MSDCRLASREKLMPTCIISNAVSLGIDSFRILSSVVIVLSYYHLYKWFKEQTDRYIRHIHQRSVRNTIENRIVDYHSF